LDTLNNIEHSIKTSIGKTKHLLRAERDQQVRSSSDAHHENNLKKQEERLEAFRVIKAEALGNEVIYIMA